MSADLAGQTIADGRYEVIEKLGEGAMGEVYRARQVAVGRMVALKLIHSATTLSVESAARFQREMKLSAKIEHANTIRVYDFGTWQGKLWLAMELVRGKSLRAELEAAGKLELSRIVRIGAQVARGLAAAHAEDVVHRDLKPDNVMLVEQYGERDLVKVLDFGIAKSLSEPDEARMTGQGAIIGTPQYMSPEQSMGQRLDERSDLYSLGIMLFELAAGRVPFEAPSITAMLVAHATQEPPKLSEYAPDAHPGLVQLVAELLAKDPAARPRTAKDVEARLNALVASDATSSRPATTGAARTQGALAQASSRGLLWAMLLSTLVGGGAAAWLWAGRSQGPSTASPPPDLPAAPAAPEPPPAAADWQLETVRVAVMEQLTAADLPTPPPECAGEMGIAAAGRILLAREKTASEPNAALQVAEQALADCPSWATAHNVHGNLLSSTGKLDAAVAAYNQALTLAPLYDAPRFNLGVVQLRRKDPAAIATFTALIAQKPSYPDVYASRAQAYLFAERYLEGLADLEQAATQDPEAGTVWLMLAQVRERLKQPNANEAYCKASELGVEAAAAHCKR